MISDIIYDEIGTGEPVILLHGLGANRHVWTMIPEALSVRYRVFNVDLKGFGDAGKEKIVDLGFTQWLQDISTLIDKHIQRPVHLIGHSLGSFIALALAASLPEQIKSVTAIACFKEFSPQLSDRFLERAVNVERDGLSTQMVNSIIDTGFSKATRANSPATIEFYKNILLNNKRENYANALRAVNRLSIAEHVHRIVCPVQIIAGKEDQVVPYRESKEVHEKLRQSVWYLIEDAGHQVHLEKHIEVYLIISEFLELIK